MKVDDVIARCKGIQCGFKPTSCPDQLANALMQAKEQKQKSRACPIGGKRGLQVAAPFRAEISSRLLPQLLSQPQPQPLLLE